MPDPTEFAAPIGSTYVDAQLYNEVRGTTQYRIEAEHAKKLLKELAALDVDTRNAKAALEVGGIELYYLTLLTNVREIAKTGKPLAKSRIDRALDKASEAPKDTGRGLTLTQYR